MTTPTGFAGRLGARLGGIARGEVSDAAVAAARNRLFHALGVGLLSTALPPAAVAWRAVEGATGECLVLGRSERTAADAAAFVNGVISHSSLQEDCGPGGLRDGSHPGTYVIPAALAAAESTHASGRALLLGLIAGYEAVGQIGAVASPQVVARGYRPVAVMGPFGAAAGAGAVFEGADDELASALTIAANMSSGTTQGIFEGTMEPYIHAGVAARNGLLAARLARAGAWTARFGFEGEFGFFRAFGGDRLESAEVADSDTYAIERLGTKRFAACLQNQLTVALLVNGFPAGVAAEQVERVVVRRPRGGTNGLDSPGVSRTPPFDNMLTAQMSARFTAAAALLGLAVDDPTFYQASYADPRVVGLAERIELVPTDDGSVSVEVALQGGVPVVLADDLPDVLFPTDAEIRQNFLRRAQPFLGGRHEEVATMIDELTELDDVRTLTALLSR